MIRFFLQGIISITCGAKMKQFKSYYLKEDIKDILLSDYPTRKKEMFLNEILDEYLFLINDIRFSHFSTTYNRNYPLQDKSYHTTLCMFLHLGVVLL